MICFNCEPHYKIIGELELEQLQPARVYPTTYFDEHLIKYRGEVVKIRPDEIEYWLARNI
jgi:hypothetical protein